MSRSAPRCPVIIFAKAPEPGYAKTRLVPALGEEGAARLARRMLVETVERAVRSCVGPVELCCAPGVDHPAFLALASTRAVTLAEQGGGGDLGARLARAFDRALASSGRAIVIGTDAPALGPEHLSAAALALGSSQAVFVPATDGGYALVGLSAPAPGLFDGIAWSTERVMEQTRERLARLALRHLELPAVDDVDEPRDLGHVPSDWLR